MSAERRGRASLTRSVTLLCSAGVLSLLLVVASPAAAHGRVIEYQLQFSPSGDPTAALAIVNVVLDPDDPLPQKVSVPVPKGAALLWAGEILGGDASGDIAHEAALAKAGDVDVCTLTLEKSYVGQVEVALDPPKVSGDELSAGMEWENSGEEALVRASVVIEPGASDVRVSPPQSGAVQQNEAGETLYPLEPRRVGKGESYVIEVQWKRGAASSADGGGQGSPGTLRYLIGAFIAALVALIAVVVRERTHGRRAMS